MNKNEQQMYKDISTIAKALTKLIRMIEKDMKNMLENIHEYMGQTATFTYFERTKANSYRHPLFKAIRDYEQK